MVVVVVGTQQGMGGVVVPEGWDRKRQVGLPRGSKAHAR